MLQFCLLPIFLLPSPLLCITFVYAYVRDELCCQHLVYVCLLCMTPLSISFLPVWWGLHARAFLFSEQPHSFSVRAVMVMFMGGDYLLCTCSYGYSCSCRRPLAWWRRWALSTLLHHMTAVFPSHICFQHTSYWIRSGLWLMAPHVMRDVWCACAGVVSAEI